MAIGLDPAKVRHSPPREVAQHLREALRTSSEEVITSQLLKLIENDSLPSSVFAPWFGVSQSPNALRQALRQQTSIQLRNLGIKQLHRCLKTAKWRMTWDFLGGVSGIIDIFGSLSVEQVRAACDAIASSAKGDDVEAKRSEYTELFKALYPHLFSEEVHQIQDRRPLRRHYQRLVFACTPQVVSKVVDDTSETISHSLRRRLMQYHTDALRARALQVVFGDTLAGEQWLSPLISQFPSEATSVHGFSTSVHGFSASMVFSLEVLKKITQGEKANISDDWVIKDLIKPLIWRIFKKKADLTLAHEVIDLVVAYFKRNSGATKYLNYENHGVLHLVALCWSRSPENLETQLNYLFSLTRKGANEIKIDTIQPLLDNIPTPERYPLVRLWFKAATSRDIDSIDDLKEVHGALTYALLSHISPGDALGIFTRMQSARGNEGLVAQGPYNSVLGSGTNPKDTAGSPDLWHTFLLQRSGHQDEAENAAIENIQEQKKAAISGSTPEQRGFYASAVLRFAVASGSLEVYGEALKWARRFDRDPLVVKQLYRPFLDESVKLLASIPTTISKDTILPENLLKSTMSANQILLGLFETACAAMRQPSFSLSDWNDVLRLFFLVVNERIHRVPEVKRKLGLSDEDVYKILWTDTLRMLITVEEKALAPGSEGLCCDSVAGVFSRSLGRNIRVKDDEPSIFRFLDDLARERDRIWCIYRPTIHPIVTTLPEPYPRGLPFPYLIQPYLLDTPYLQTHAPYIASRVEAAIFPNPKLATAPFSSDEETQAGIGSFVDDYSQALFYFALAPTALDKEEKRKRVQQAWTYATGPLSQGRMSPEEAVRYWQKEVFSGQMFEGIGFDPTHPSIDPMSQNWPAIPDVDLPGEVEEWNPLPSDVTEISSRKLDPLTYIDLSAGISTNGGSISTSVKTRLARFTMEIFGQTEENVWSYERIKRARAHPLVREGQILSALLFLDTFSSGNTHLLSKPFPPSTAHFRFPAVYLDGKFLTGNSEKYAAIGALKSHISSVPAFLLARVAENAIQTLIAADPETNGYVDVERLAFSLLGLLAQSDRPALASDLAIQTVLLRPDASSWHRVLLSSRFFNRLPASEAQVCITSFSDAIIAKLDEQQNANEARKANAKDAEASQISVEQTMDKHKGFVKVTTVKFLAELLRGTSFVSEEFSLSILVKLIHKASHIDIRRTVVSSLLDMLKSASQSLISQIITALESIIPLAGNIRERRPITNHEWTLAEEMLEPPEIELNFSLEEHAPLLKLLLDFLKCQPTECKNFTHRREYEEKIISPIINSLKFQTGKWVSIFLCKHGLDLSAQHELDIPPLPLNKNIFKELLQSGSSHLSPSWLEELVAYMTFNIAPPSAIATLTKKLKGWLPWRDARDVKFWLRHFDAGPNVVRYFDDNFNILTLLKEPSQLKDHITPKHVQQQYLKLYTVILWHDAVGLGTLSYVTDPLWDFSPHVPISKDWVEHYKPIVEAIVLYVETLRTREWQKGPDRRPKALPDTWRSRMLLLQYSAQHSPEIEVGDREAHCRGFAARVHKYIEQISGGVYHAKFVEMKRALDYVREDDRLRVACYLGDITKTKLSWLSLEDHLRVELAAELVGGQLGTFSGDNALETRTEALKKSWEQSESEEVRRLAFKLRDAVEAGKTGESSGGTSLFTRLWG